MFCRIEDLDWARAYARICASKFTNFSDQDDLQSAGIVAFLRAADRYVPSKGIPFRGFCATRIRGAIIDEVRRWGWAPRSYYSDYRKLDSAASALRNELDREPTAYELGLKLGISEGDIESLQEFTRPRQMFSWDHRCNNDEEDSGCLSERVADELGHRPDVEILSREERNELLASIGRLPRMQALVIVLHYLRDAPLGSVAQLTGLTASRISQLHQQALARLRVLMTSHHH